MSEGGSSGRLTARLNARVRHEATAVSSALSHLVARNEIERLPDGRYRATEHLKEPKKQP